jgi:hypothetical protein
MEKNMFRNIGDYISNKDKEFLKSSDIVVDWKSGYESDIRFDENIADEKLALLLSRLAYVFELVDDKIKAREDYEEFVDILNGVRIKKTLQSKNITLPEIANIMSKIDTAKKVSFVINEDDLDTIQALISFCGMIGCEKMGMFFAKLDEEFFEFKLIEE